MQPNYTGLGLHERGFGMGEIKPIYNDAYDPN